jgi:hypothetical protein
MKYLMVVLTLLLAVVHAEAGNPAPPSPSPASGLPAHVTLPWGLGVTGAARNVWVAPRTVVVDTHLQVPAAPGQAAMATSETEGRDEPRDEAAPRAETAPQYAVWRQTAIVPGYWVREVSTGFFYPQRWTLEQTHTGYYQWRLLPAEFRPR